MPEEGLWLERWANFYLVASTAAATLLGLLFILITLAADRRPTEQGKIRIASTSSRRRVKNTEGPDQSTEGLLDAARGSRELC